MTRGLFIVIEGGEGSGKSTQAARLAAWLEARSIAHVVVREPGGTELGEEIRRLLLDSDEVPRRAELLLMLAARAVFVEERVRPHLEAGAVVISDRYELSTLAYQGYGRGLDLDEIRRLNAFATGGLRPDLTLVLEVPLDIGEARRARAGRGADRIERAGRAFHERVSEAYRLLADTEPGVERIDGTGTPEEVHAAVVDRLRARFPETFASGPG